MNAVIIMKCSMFVIISIIIIIISSSLSSLSMIVINIGTEGLRRRSSYTTILD